MSGRPGAGREDRQDAVPRAPTAASRRPPPCAGRSRRPGRGPTPPREFPPPLEVGRGPQGLHQRDDPQVVPRPTPRGSAALRPDRCLPPPGFLVAEGDSGHAPEGHRLSRLSQRPGERARPPFPDRGLPAPRPQLSAPSSGSIGLATGMAESAAGELRPAPWGRTPTSACRASCSRAGPAPCRRSGNNSRSNSASRASAAARPRSCSATSTPSRRRRSGPAAPSAGSPAHAP